MIRKFFFVFIFSQLLVLHLIAQNSSKDKKVEKAMAIKKQIADTNFIFEARYVVPQTGQMRYLTDYYSLKIAHDSLIVYLPYFGRSYIAPMDPAKIAIDLTTTNFEYTSTPLKKGGWDITIRPTSQQTVQLFTLTVYDNGEAYLKVLSSDRDPISYNGSLEVKK